MSVTTSRKHSEERKKIREGGARAGGTKLDLVPRRGKSPLNSGRKKKKIIQREEPLASGGGLFTPLNSDPKGGSRVQSVRNQIDGEGGRTAKRKITGKRVRGFTSDRVDPQLNDWELWGLVGGLLRRVIKDL